MEPLVQTPSKPKLLRINEIFFSIQGESTKTGLPTVFIRLTGCPLRCRYCDTAYAFYEGDKMSVAEIIKKIDQYHTKHVTVTGGEPLAQAACHALLSSLCDKDYQVSLETSGALDIANVDPRIIKIMDIKTPDSDEQHKNQFENLAYLGHQDQIKFVISSRTDYDFAKQTIVNLKLTDICEVLFSPAYETLNPTDLANWILADQLTVRLQVQLHKYLWGNTKGR